MTALGNWSVPRMWEGRTVAVLASGPSMSQSIADDILLSELPTVVVNTTFRLAPWADVLYAADQGWWLRYAKELTEFKGLRVSCTPASPRIGAHLLTNTGKVGFDPDPSCIRTGGNSGYAALHLAVHAGAARILLCGFNMSGEGHWHGRHPDPLRNAGTGIYARWLLHFQGLAVALKERNVEVLNCTPGSALTMWPHVSLEEALEALPA